MVNLFSQLFAGEHQLIQYTDAVNVSSVITTRPIRYYVIQVNGSNILAHRLHFITFEPQPI